MAQLGLSLPSLDEKTTRRLKLNLSTSRDNGVNQMDLHTAFEQMQQRILEAWELREDELPDWVPEVDKLTFEKLSRLLRL